MRCWRMRCWDIWRCWGKWRKPSKPGFTQVNAWWNGDMLTGQEWIAYVQCFPGTVDDEVQVEVSNPNIARFKNLELNWEDETQKYYIARFDIIWEGYVEIVFRSKNNPTISASQERTAFTPTPVDTFSFDENSLTIPQDRTVLTTATYSPDNAYIWQWLDINAQEWDTPMHIYQWLGGWHVRLYGTSNADVWATRTLQARYLDSGVLDTIEADVVEPINAQTAEFTEHSITIQQWETYTMQLTNITPAWANNCFAASSLNWDIASRDGDLLKIRWNNPWTTTITLEDWDTWETYDTCEVTVEAPVYPTIEFVDWDTNINVWETWTLRFRYTNATSFSDDVDYPLIADVTHISSDGEYCYITYEWASDWVCHISAIAWNWDINISAWVQVTVVWVPLEPITSINQFSTDYTTIARKYAMRNLWTVSPSEGADVNSIGRGMPQELYVEGARIENWTLYAVVYGDEWDWNLCVTLQNWNQYIYTFHIQPDIPVESIEEHFAYNIDVSLWGAVTTEFSYLPTNATNFSGITWRWSVWAEEIAQPWGWRYDNWTLYRNINWIGEWNCTLTWMLNDVWFTTVNVTVDPR